MKNEILDDIFNDDLRNLLKKEEKVIWEGRPSMSPFREWVTVIGLTITILVLLQFFKTKLDFVIIIYPIGLGIFGILKWRQSKKVRYLITDQRILFQLWEKRKKVIREVPLEAIKKISVRKENKNNGAILIYPKNKKYSFNSKNLRTGEPRYLPSLEMIEDVESVGEYIETEIQKRLE